MCNFMHVVNSDSGLSGTVREVRLFPTHPDLMPLFGVILSEFQDKPYVTKTRMMWLSDGEDFVILA